MSMGAKTGRQVGSVGEEGRGGSLFVELSKRSTWVLGTRIHALSEDEALGTILGWAESGESRSVAFCNVHMVMEGHGDRPFQELVNGSDLILPDGMPVAWTMRLEGRSGQPRVCGPDLTLLLCQEAAAKGIPVGFLGSTENTLKALKSQLIARFPGLRIVTAISPPFRPLEEGEDAILCQTLREEGCRLLFVGLGCPKQERWASEHRGAIPAVMLGVGAAFDFHAGTLPMAPAWMRSSGLEWLFRLVCEPRRLWKRYLNYNSRFLLLSAKLIAERLLLKRNHVL